MILQAFFMKKFLEIQIEINSSEESEILVAQLSENKYYAFEEEENWLCAYVIQEDFDEKKLKEILPEGTRFTRRIIEEENWNQQWESEVKPVVVKGFVAIRPSFHKAVENVKHDLIITPKMSFGTGHHATTFLMIEMMESIDFNNKTVIDFGTGTGVLAILAEKCGASEIIALDNHDWSIENAQENIVANNCERIILQKKEDLSGIKPVDIVLSNINLNVIKDASKLLSSTVKKAGLLLVSGFFISDEFEIENVFHNAGFFKIKSAHLGDWVSVLLEKI